MPATRWRSTRPLCATAALDLYNDMELAAFCLLHDAHETWTGDNRQPHAGGAGRGAGARRPGRSDGRPDGRPGARRAPESSASSPSRCQNGSTRPSSPPPASTRPAMTHTRRAHQGHRHPRPAHRARRTEGPHAPAVGRADRDRPAAAPARGSLRQMSEDDARRLFPRPPPRPLPRPATRSRLTASQGASP